MTEELFQLVKKADSNGVIPYSDREHLCWATLSRTQRQNHRGRACGEYLEGLASLDLPTDRIPAIGAVSESLYRRSGWRLEVVPGLISFEDYFELLARRHFPCTTFIRSWEELDLSRDPDIFHEIFGHCPLLTNKAYSRFIQAFAAMLLEADPRDRPLLQRLYWFTVEVGLVQTQAGLRIFGGSCLSSIKECVFCLESDGACRLPFDLVKVFRTPYRVDMHQPIYFVMATMASLYALVDRKRDIKEAMKIAHALGEFKPLFPVENSPYVHKGYCIGASHEQVQVGI